MSVSRHLPSVLAVLAAFLWGGPARAADDTDGDGLLDVYEAYLGTDPLSY